jgi:membrane-associated phospholipid phosphatase
VTAARASAQPSFCGWPGWAHLGYALWLQLLATAWFLFVYGGADLLTRRRTLRVPVHLAFEPGLPLWPGLVVVYLSLHVLFAGAPFVLRTRPALRALTLALAAVIGTAGVGFLLVPAELAYPPPAGLGAWAGLFHFADRMNLDYNLVPSLHVALGVVCVAAYAGQAPPAGAALLWGWAGALAVSTVLTHQHHLVDAVTGFGLGLAGDRLVYRRLAAGRPIPGRSPSSRLIGFRRQPTCRRRS